MLGLLDNSIDGLFDRDGGADGDVVIVADGEGLGLSDGLYNPKLQSIVFSPSSNSKQMVLPLSELIVLSTKTTTSTSSTTLILGLPFASLN